MNLVCSPVVDIRATWHTFQPKLKKQKKKSTLKKFLILFQTKFFLIFPEMELSNLQINPNLGGG